MNDRDLKATELSARPGTDSVPDSSTNPSANSRRSRRNKNKQKNQPNAANGVPAAASASNDAGVSTGSDALAHTLAKNGLNDPRWYLKYPALINAVGRPAFLNRPGSFTQLNSTTTNNENGMYNKYIPSIMQLEWRPAFGTCQNPRDPANNAARYIWNRIRDAYSGTIRVAPADLFMYMMHLCNWKSYISWLKRLFGTMNDYTPYNNHMPYELFAAQFPGMPMSRARFMEWRKRRNELYTFIEEQVNQINTYLIPDGASIYDRQAFMNECIYQDSDSPIAQLYVFTPNGFYYADPAGENGTRLVYAQIPSAPDLDAVKNIGQRFFDNLFFWSDSKTMNGYIMKAFAGHYYPPCESIGPDYQVWPVYQPEVLLQIHNARLAQAFTEPEVNQDPGTDMLLIAPQAMVESLEYPPIIDMPVMDVDPVSMVVATRLAPVFYPDPHDASKFIARTGTEVILNAFIFQWSGAINSIAKRLDVFQAMRMGLGASTTAEGTKSELVQFFNLMAQYGAFASAPLLPIYMNIAGSEGYSSYVGEVNNIVEYPIAQMEELHKQCLASELNIYEARPESAKASADSRKQLGR